ncbi:MAG: hypothetical protein ACK5HT_16745, partial [Draconibacterium sp.]
RGIEQSDKASLNLKLKKGKMDFSGSFNCGGGMFDDNKPAFDQNANILGITKIYKSFITLNYNNVGHNYSPIDYYGFNFSMEELKEDNFYARKLISETHFSNLLDDNRGNINNQVFGSYNSAVQIGERLRVRANLFYLQDKITSNQILENQYQINGQEFTTIDNTDITKKPQQDRADAEIKWNTSESSLLEYNFRARNENIGTPSRISQNQEEEYESFLETKDFYLKQNLLFTKKLSKKEALQFSFFHSYNKLPQEYRISPSQYNGSTEKITQKSEFTKTYIEGKTTFLGAGNRNKYSFAFGGNLSGFPFKSNLFDEKNTISKNIFDYSQKKIFNTGVYNINRRNWRFSPSYSICFLNQKLNEKTEGQNETRNDFVFETDLRIKYKLNDISFFNLGTGISKHTNTEQYLFLNQVLIDNRTTVIGTCTCTYLNISRL